MSAGEDNVFRILLATDNHLGYKLHALFSYSLCRESDPIIGNDSFQSFEFILQTAREMKVYD